LFITDPDLQGSVLIFKLLIAEHRIALIKVEFLKK